MLDNRPPAMSEAKPEFRSLNEHHAIMRNGTEDGTEDGADGDRHQCTVLLVDDEPEILLEMSDYLHIKGFVCKTAPDAATALKIVDEDQDIGLVITDIRMPRMSGLEMLRRLREGIFSKRNLETIVLTGHAGRDEAIEALQFGAIDFLTKPVSLKQLAVSAGRAVETVHWRQMEKTYKAALEKALEKERQLNQMQREFIALVSHEFRTPLAIIDSTAQRITRSTQPVTDEYLSERVGVIRSTINRMTDLIDETLSVARYEEGRFDLRLQNCNLGQVLRGICHRQFQIGEGCLISIEIDDLPQSIQADTKQIDIVLTNLVSNAVKYSSENSRVDINGWTEGNDVLISVRDGGVGIPKNEIPMLFSRFYRASTSSGVSGTGLGLYLSKMLVEMHEGSIEVDSEVNTGTIFTVRFPMSLGCSVHKTGTEGQEAPGAFAGQSLRPEHAGQ